MNKIVVVTDRENEFHEVLLRLKSVKKIITELEHTDIIVSSDLYDLLVEEGYENVIPYSDTELGDCEHQLVSLDDVHPDAILLLNVEDQLKLNPMHHELFEINLPVCKPGVFNQFIGNIAVDLYEGIFEEKDMSIEVNDEGIQTMSYRLERPDGK